MERWIARGSCLATGTFEIFASTIHFQVECAKQICNFKFKSSLFDGLVYNCVKIDWNNHDLPARLDTFEHVSNMQQIGNSRINSFDLLYFGVNIKLFLPSLQFNWMHQFKFYAWLKSILPTLSVLILLLSSTNSRSVWQNSGRTLLCKC